MAKIFQNLVKTINSKIHKAQQNYSSVNQMKTTSMHSIIKLIKTGAKENI